MAEDAIPSLLTGQLLRIFHQLLQEGGDIAQRSGGPAGFGVGTGDGERGLTGMPGFGGDGIKEQGAAGDGFTMALGISQTDKQVPPVVNQGNSLGHQPTALEITSCKSGPAPLVLQFVKVIFAIAAIPIKLAERGAPCFAGPNLLPMPSGSW
jgi:hypothetical protein